MAQRTITQKIAVGLCVLALQVLFTPKSQTQVTTATISGVVKDATAAVLPSVSITIKNVETGISRAITTDGQGRYYVPDLSVGSYEVRTNLTGFKEFLRDGITLVVGQNAVINITLELGDVSERVTVTGEAPLVDTTTSDVSHLVSSTQVRELPLNGRSYDQLALLQPGVQAFRQVEVSANTSFSTRISVSGARINANNIMMDGIEVNDWTRSGGGSVGGLFLGVDAIQEFKMLTHNYSAEFGRNAGAIMNIITRSGTNSFHGSVYEFLRNEKLDARNFFDAEKPPLRRNQFGVFVSGPIHRDRAFFAANYEGFRERRSRPDTFFTLTAEARRGLLPTGQVNVAPAILPYLGPDVLPLPNAGVLSGGTVGRYSYQFLRPVREDFGMGRIDYRVGDSDTLFVRYSRSASTGDDPGFRWHTPFGKEVNEFPLQNGVVGYTRMFGPALINDLRLGVKRTIIQLSAVMNSDFPVDRFKFVPGQPLGQVRVTGLTNSPIGMAGLKTTAFWKATSPQLSDAVVFARGAHTFKAGVTYNLIRDFMDNGAVKGGLWEFTSIPNFLTATPASFIGDLPTRDISNDFVQHYFGWYILDDYRVTPTLTLNLGLRHEFVTSPYDRRPGYTGAIVDPLRDTDTSASPVFTHLTMDNVAPRLGLAWDVFGDGKMSVRSGFGMYHNLWMGRDFENQAQPAPAYRGQVVIRTPVRQPEFPNEFLVQQSLGFPVVSLRPAGRLIKFFDLQTPTMLHYSLEVQRQLSSTALLRVGYVGSKGYHLASTIRRNTTVPTFLPDGRIFFARGAPLVNPNLNPLEERGSESDSRYNSLQTTFRLQPTHGLELQVSYVWSRSIDNSSATAGADSWASPPLIMNPYDFSADRGLSVFDIRHLFTLNYLYELPSVSAQGVLGQLVNGWSVGGIVSMSTGNPLSPSVGFCRSNVAPPSCGEDRPDLTPGARNNPVLGDPNRYFDPGAFTLPEAGFFGNNGRNTVIGPGLASMDFSIYKRFPVAEGKALQFRVEIFNLFNRANFANPANSLFTSSGARQASAGVITRTVSTSREIQFGLKFNF